MMSQMLREARKTEEIMGKQFRSEDKPAFHLTPKTGWMNDPNGFCFYNGKYHMFYQYNPYSSHWDTMHWGHAVSTDLLHWEHLPAALAPDEIYDYNGCFSGSAAALPDGRLLLMYTGVRHEIGPGGRRLEIQTQNIAIGDGLDFDKYEGNPVLDEKDLPEGASRVDFRDPKIICLSDGSYMALIGSRPADGSGQILKYVSEDCLHWTFAGKLVQNRCRFGKMWECPDFFKLDGMDVLLTSPQDMLPEGFEYHNGNGTLCLIGESRMLAEKPDMAGNEGDGSLDEEDDFIPAHNQAIDYGIDFYAPQTVLAPDGRRIMIGWMQNWDSVAIREPDEPWAGQMSIPREIHIKDGRLWQWPVKELEELRKEAAAYRDITVEGNVRLDWIGGRTLDLELTLKPQEGGLYHKFSLWFAEDENFHTAISYRPHEKTLKIDRKFSGSRRAIIHQRRAKVRDENGELKLRVILDRFSVEIFINGGEQVMSAGLYTPLSADKITFRCDGTVKMDVTCWKL